MMSDWIKVSDRLPKGVSKVLAWDGKFKQVALWNTVPDFMGDPDKYYWRNWDNCITHWMPLPEPPK